MNYKIFTVLYFLLLSCNDFAVQSKERGPGWRKLTSAEDLWQEHPDKVAAIFARIDLDYQGLETVKDALNAGDTLLASQKLLDYYRKTSTVSWLRSRKYQFESPEEKQQAQQLLKDKVTFNDVTADVPESKNGGWKWTYTGPGQDDEFGYSLNGHKYFPLFLKGWHETGNSAYVEKFDLLIRDWIIHNPLPEPTDSIYLVHQTSTEALDWRDIGEVVWRDLEVGRRFSDAWPQTFYQFQQEEEFSSAGRLLMLYSIPVQADYLKKYHKERHNWTTIEMAGLAHVGLTFPEFKDSEQWVEYALKVMQEEINEQVYPDGTQTELSTKTQWVALDRFESLVENFRNASRKIPESYLKRIEEMYNYMAYAMRPDGHQPLNNDSDREDLRPRVLKAAAEFDRPDWVYIATNGAKGNKPDGLATAVFPWAGIHTMRNGWDQDSHWAFFDAGPYGTGHQHRDMLHLSIYAYGRDLLVDGGRFTHKDYFSFDPSNWRGYFRSSFSHNVILVDGQGQNSGPLITDQPLQQEVEFVNQQDFDYARGTFSSGFNQVDGEIEHSRAVLYLRNKYWVVVDRVTTDKPRQLQVLWHYNPTCKTTIESEEQVVSTDAGLGNLRIVPVSGDVSWKLEMISGKTEPYIQGWYSETYGKKEPNPTAVYSANVQSDATFAWVLMPAKGDVPKVEAELLEPGTGKVRIVVANEDPVVVTVPPVKGAPVIE